MDINNKNTQQTLFCRQFSCKFCAKHFLTKILHFIKNEHTTSLKMLDAQQGLNVINLRRSLV